jgi:hypothetical protein
MLPRNQVGIVGSESGQQKSPPFLEGFLIKRLKRLELSTFCMASRRSSQLSYSRALQATSIATPVWCSGAAERVAQDP